MDTVRTNVHDKLLYVAALDAFHRAVAPSLSRGDLVYGIGGPEGPWHDALGAMAADGMFRYQTGDIASMPEGIAVATMVFPSGTPRGLDALLRGIKNRLPAGAKLLVVNRTEGTHVRVSKRLVRWWRRHAMRRRDGTSDKLPPQVGRRALAAAIKAAGFSVSATHGVKTGNLGEHVVSVLAIA